MWPVKMVTSSKLDEPSMQARKSGHTAHHWGGIARTEWCGPMQRTTAPLRTLPPWTRVQAQPRIFVVTPLSAKTICPSAWCFTQHANPTPSTTTHSRTRPFPAHQPNHVIFNPAQDYDRGQAKLEPKKTIYERVQLLQNLQQKADAQLKLVIGKIRPHPTKLECAEAFNPLLELANNLRADVDTVDTGNVMR